MLQWSECCPIVDGQTDGATAGFQGDVARLLGLHQAVRNGALCTAWSMRRFADVCLVLLRLLLDGMFLEAAFTSATGTCLLSIDEVLLRLTVDHLDLIGLRVSPTLPPMAMIYVPCQVYWASFCSLAARL